MAYGAIVVSLRVPDRDGALGDVVLGYDDLDGLPRRDAVLRRRGRPLRQPHRAAARFTLDGREYMLADQRRAEPPARRRGAASTGRLGRRSRARGDGAGVAPRATRAPTARRAIPGTLDVRVTYTLTERRRAASSTTRATTDEPTLVNLTQHSYFNLAGQGRRRARPRAARSTPTRYTPVDATLHPHRRARAGRGHAVRLPRADARSARASATPTSSSAHGRGYDHNFVLTRRRPGLVPRGAPGRAGDRAACWTSTRPSRACSSTPATSWTARSAARAAARTRRATGLCLETQHFPDSPNQPDFPSTILRPGETYRSRTVFAFSTTGADGGVTRRPLGGFADMRERSRIAPRRESRRASARWRRRSASPSAPSTARCTTGPGISPATRAWCWSSRRSSATARTWRRASCRRASSTASPCSSPARSRPSGTWCATACSTSRARSARRASRPLPTARRPHEGDADVAQALKEDFQGLVLAPGRPEVAAPLIAQAARRGLPVVCVNTDAPGSERLCTVSVDSLASGGLAAELMGRFLGGRGTVVVVTGFESTIDHAEKVEGFQRMLFETSPGDRDRGGRRGTRRRGRGLPEVHGHVRRDAGPLRRLRHHRELAAGAAGAARPAASPPASR